MKDYSALTDAFDFGFVPFMSMDERVRQYREKMAKLQLENFIFDKNKDDDILKSMLFCGVSVRLHDLAQPIPFNAINRISSEIRESLSSMLEGVEYFIKDLWKDHKGSMFEGLDFHIQRNDDSWVSDISDAQVGAKIVDGNSFARFWAEIMEKQSEGSAHKFRVKVYASHLSASGSGMADVLIVSPDDKIVDEIYDRKFKVLNDVISLIRSRYISDMVDHLKYVSTKSAIGSIMSRNGSHNIGSHVLAALSHNVGTMPDDQVLYQYIQHRMDYIATATTDRPTWTQPSMFVGDMVRRLLSQRHLLNYICRSEGLKAFEFQSDRARINDNGGRIRLHVRKVDAEIDDNGVYNFKNVKQDFINYSRDKIDNKIDLKEDVSLAIPGGVVGQHAFFTIIENIIRNAAKHDWSTPPKATAVLKDAPIEPDQEGLRTGDLDVYIDYIDKPENENVQFVVWTRLSDVEDGKDDRNDKTLDVTQQKKLEESFVSDGGVLRRENWGLAEMKISAGYLQKAKIEDIGGISKNKGADIIKPCKISDVWSSDKNQLKKGDGKDFVQHLGYTFDVPKAKLMLFVVDEMPDKWNSSIRTSLLRKGVYVKEYEAIKQCQEGTDDSNKFQNYQYVILDDFGEDQKKWMLPFRILAAKSNTGFEGHIPLLERIDGERPVRVKSVSQYLSSVIDKCKQKKDGSSDAQENKLYEVIVSDICSCWVRHLIKKKRVGECGLKNKRVSLIVSATGNDKKAGQSLATIEDVVEFAFNEGLDKALETYKNSICTELFRQENEKDTIWGVNLNKKICDALIAQKNSGCMVYKRSEAFCEDYEPFIKRQLGEWLKDSEDSELLSASNFLCGETSGEMDQLKAQLEDINRKYAELPDGSEREKVGVAYDNIAKKIKLIEDVDKLKWPIEHLIAYIASYCDQIKNFLSKYSENIATLPKGFTANGGGGVFSKGWKDAQIDQYNKELMKQVDDPIKDKQVETYLLRYWRHETQKKAADYYLEPLSGTQTYLNLLFSIGEKQFDFVARLVENALFRILIVDERTREFLENHPTKKATFRNMGIFVADDKKVADELEALDRGDNINESNALLTAEGFVNLSSKTVHEVGALYKNNGNKVRESIISRTKEKFHDKYDAIIIHQGIIDKWIPGSSHSKEKVERFIDGLKRVFKYVVITTGRGTPANIPDSGRVLPFSTIQTTLFKQYPEKLILTDAVMNILPVRCGKGDAKHDGQ